MGIILCRLFLIGVTMLDQYVLRTQQLLQAPAAPTELYAEADIIQWVNQGRGQLAGEGKCIRAIGTLPTVIGQRAYNFSSINFGTSAITGIAGAINVRSIQVGVGDGLKWINARGWTWFNFYNMSNVTPQQGEPAEWSQLAQGTTGSFYVDPPPDTVYTLSCDCVCQPIDLVDDTTVEALPYLWTDAVAYFAAYLAFLSAQSPARQNDAARMFEHYSTFVDRARQFATPDVNYTMYPQSKDPAQLAKLGLSPKSAAGGG
jgi:hypothetical protein